MMRFKYALTANDCKTKIRKKCSYNANDIARLGKQVIIANY